MRDQIRLEADDGACFPRSVMNDSRFPSRSWSCSTKSWPCLKLKSSMPTTAVADTVNAVKFRSKRDVARSPEHLIVDHDFSCIGSAPPEMWMCRLWPANESGKHLRDPASSMLTVQVACQ